MVSLEFFIDIILPIALWPWGQFRIQYDYMTSRNASDHVNPAGIAVSMPKGTTSKEMGANRNFGKWLSYGRGISGSFG
jgi:hypothetical protein